MEQQTVKNEEYKVNLEVFEGPLDLLLHLIRKNDLSITDIPIARITEEYLRYIDVIKELDVNVAGEYLLMAAELMQIKSRMLLPVEEQGEAEAVEEDPRADLMRRLLEYQRYKAAALEIAHRPILNRDEFLPLAPERIQNREEILANESVYKLLEVFQVLVSRIPADRVQEVNIDRISVNEKIMQLVEMIKSKETLAIEALLPKKYGKYDLVITFLALLEMVKLAMIRVYQAGKFETIYVTGILEEVSSDEALKLLDEEDTPPL